MKNNVFTKDWWKEILDLNEVIVNKPSKFNKEQKWMYSVNNKEEWDKIAPILDSLGYKWYDGDSLISYNPYENPETETNTYPHIYITHKDIGTNYIFIRYTHNIHMDNLDDFRTINFDKNILPNIQEVTINKPGFKLPIIISSSEQYEKISKILDKLGYRWYGGDLVSSFNPFKDNVRGDIGEKGIILYNPYSTKPELKYVGWSPNISMYQIDEVIMNKPISFSKEKEFSITLNKEEWDKIAPILDKKGILWGSGALPTEYSPWENSKISDKKKCKFNYKKRTEFSEESMYLLYIISEDNIQEIKINNPQKLIKINKPNFNELSLEDDINDFEEYFDIMKYFAENNPNLKKELGEISEESLSFLVRWAIDSKKTSFPRTIRQIYFDVFEIWILDFLNTNDGMRQWNSIFTDIIRKQFSNSLFSIEEFNKAKELKEVKTFTKEWWKEVLLPLNENINSDIVEKVVKGFDLIYVPKAFSNAYTTTKDNVTRTLADRINKWITTNFPYTDVRVRYEGTYKTVNFYRLIKENKELINNKKIFIKSFIKFAIKELKLKNIPQIILSQDTKKAQEIHTFGTFEPSTGKIWLYIKNRNAADILRTLAHELIHRKQEEEGRIKIDSGETGSKIENEANALAGVLLRKFGEQNNNIYEGLINELKINKPSKFIKDNNWYYKLTDINQWNKIAPILNDLEYKWLNGLLPIEWGHKPHQIAFPTYLVNNEGILALISTLDVINGDNYKPIQEVTINKPINSPEIPFTLQEFQQLKLDIEEKFKERLKDYNEFPPYKKPNMSMEQYYEMYGGKPKYFSYGTLYNDAISFGCFIENINENDRKIIQELLNNFIKGHRFKGFKDVNIFPNEVWDDKFSSNTRIGIYLETTGPGGRINELIINKPSKGIIAEFYKKMDNGGKIYNIIFPKEFKDNFRALAILPLQDHALLFDKSEDTDMLDKYKIPYYTDDNFVRVSLNNIQLIEKRINELIVNKPQLSNAKSELRRLLNTDYVKNKYSKSWRLNALENLKTINLNKAAQEFNSILVWAPLEFIRNNNFNIFDKINEGIYGNYLFGDKESGVKVKWYDNEVEKDTPAEKILFNALQQYIDSERETYSNINLDQYINLFKTLRKEYPNIADSNIKPDQYIYRGTSINKEQLEKLQKNTKSEKFNQGIIIFDKEYKSRRIISSWSLNYYNAASFAQSTAEINNEFPVVMRTKAKEADLFFNPNFINKLSYNIEDETFNIKNPIKVDIMLINDYEDEFENIEQDYLNNK